MGAVWACGHTSDPVIIFLHFDSELAAQVSLNKELNQFQERCPWLNLNSDLPIGGATGHSLIAPHEEITSLQQQEQWNRPNIF